jgi:hypothetical protein
MTYDKGVPMPPDKRRKSGLSESFRRAAVGDSWTTESTFNTAQSMASRMGRAHGKRFAVRVAEGGQVRIWRLE